MLPCISSETVAFGILSVCVTPVWVHLVECNFQWLSRGAASANWTCSAADHSSSIWLLWDWCLLSHCTDGNGAFSAFQLFSNTSVNLLIHQSTPLPGKTATIPLHFSGLLAKKAVEAGLTVRPYIKTSLSPGSGVVTYYLRESGVMTYLSQLG